jgi:outer membrane protein OmpA-like peptidoglycan-associated protein
MNDEFEQLSSLLGGGTDKKRISRLEQRLDDALLRSQEIAAILPTALRATPDVTDLIAALQMPVDECIKYSLQNESNNLINTIMPSVTPLVRQLTQQSLQSLEEILKTHKKQLVELKKALDDFELSASQQQKQLNRLDKQSAENNNELKIQRLETLLQNQQSQLEEIENYFKQLEQVYLQQREILNQHAQFWENLEKTYTTDLTQLQTTQQQQQAQHDQLTQQVNNLARQQQQSQEELTSFEKYLENLEKVHVNQQFKLDKFQQQVLTLGKLQVTQQKKLAAFQQQMVKLAQLGKRLQQIEHRLNDPEQRALDMADILPEAIRQSTQQMMSNIGSGVTSQMTTQLLDQEAEKAKLTESLQMPVEICIQQSIKKNVAPFADALFPLIGPAIRRSIGEAFKELLQRINTLLQHSIFSRKGIAWRIQAWRTGQSFAEVVLMQTFIYRVEQVFLIHRESGLLILHAHVEGVDVGDSDAVSAMFTAIQDFTRDSFSVNKQEELESLQVGQYTVWVERSPYAILACVIRGMAPNLLRNLMTQQLELIHGRYGALLKDFDGDNTPLQSALPLLEETLKSEMKAGEKPRWMSPQLFIILGVISILLALWGYYTFEFHRRLNSYLQALQETPGIVINKTKKESGKWVVYGMRDPLAPAPKTFAEQYGLTEEQVIFQGRWYQDLDPHFVEQRLRRWLKPPKTVNLSLQNTVLHLSGHADQAWIDKVNDSIGLISGVTEVISENLINTELQFQAFIEALTNTPGILIVSSGIENGQRFVTGMRDPLAEAPEEIAKRMQITDIAMRWTSYQDLNPSFVEKRVRQRLEPPPTVQVQVQNEVLHLQGHAPQGWIDKARQQSVTIVGINELDIANLLETNKFLLQVAQRKLMPPKPVTLTVKERVLRLTGRVDTATYQRLQQQLQSLKESKNTQLTFKQFDSSQLVDIEQAQQQLIDEIETTVIYFTDGASQLMPGEETILKNLITKIKQVIRFSQELQQTLQIQLTGNTDGVGTEVLNKQLSEQRAKTIANRLHNEGIALTLIKIVPPASIPFGDAKPVPRHRNVSFQIIIIK